AEDGTRTRDPNLGKVVLYQLSHFRVCRSRIAMQVEIRQSSSAIRRFAYMRDTTRSGDLAELEITIALVRAGKRVLKPLSSACRYDLAIDEGDGHFTRVQCKSG